jgi:hypothetical protein
MAVTPLSATVVQGLDVVDKIASVRKDYNDRPLTPVVIEKAIAVDEPVPVSEEDLLIFGYIRACRF